jgi:dihydroorotate dehydrogenase
MTLYKRLKPLLFLAPAETTHQAVYGALRAIAGTPLEDLLAARYVLGDPRLRVEALGGTFPNPVGVAAGFDKNGEIPGVLASLGFGHVEVGGVTADRQAGNPRPRLFRLPENEALINRMGFNNDGADAIGARLARKRVDVPLGVNLGKSKATPPAAAPADYRYSYERVATSGDFFVVNVSSPNTPGLRDLQQHEALEEIVAELREAGADPLLIKLSPDLTESAIDDVLDVVREFDLNGVIATNTTTARSESLRSHNRVETGGLSGKPIEARATEVTRFVAERVAEERTVIGVGGVASAVDAYRKIRAGADLVQLYTGLVYGGPAIAREINRGLLALLDRDGFDSVTGAIGADLD